MSKASMRRRWQKVDGIFLLDKALGESSNTALQRVRRVFHAAKAGHTGTLDPLATGLLPVMFGEASKFSHLLLDADKTYTATVKLGVTTSTGDAEGEVLSQMPVNVSETQIRAACAQFIGDIQQLPPMFSALKHKGKALYEYARAGIDIERTPRHVYIHALEASCFTPDAFQIRVRCSKGTYIRTLAEDIGVALQCGAHLTKLRRIAVGPLSIDKALTQEALEAQSEDQHIALLLPLDSLLIHMPEVEVDVVMALRFSQGQTLGEIGKALGSTGDEIRVYAQADHTFLGVAEINPYGGLKPKRLLSNA